MIKVTVSELARKDMRDINNYICFRLKNPSAASKLIRSFVDEFKGLKSFPESGAPIIFEDERSTNYRYLVSGNFMIFYHPNNGEIIIDRILYGKSNYLSILFGDE